MIDEKKRDTPPSWRWYDFADTFFVECPACRNAAIVKIPGAFIQRRPLLIVLSATGKPIMRRDRFTTSRQCCMCGVQHKAPPSTIKLPKIKNLVIIN